MGRFRELMKERDARLGVAFMAASPVIAALLPTQGITHAQELVEILTPIGVFITGSRLWNRATEKFSYGTFEPREECTGCDIDSYLKRKLAGGARFLLDALMRRE